MVGMSLDRPMMPSGCVVSLSFMADQSELGLCSVEVSPTPVTVICPIGVGGRGLSAPLKMYTWSPSFPQCPAVIAHLPPFLSVMVNHVVHSEYCPVGLVLLTMAMGVPAGIPSLLMRWVGAGPAVLLSAVGVRVGGFCAMLLCSKISARPMKIMVINTALASSMVVILAMARCLCWGWLWFCFIGAKVSYWVFPCVNTGRACLLPLVGMIVFRLLFHAVALAL